MSVNAPASVRGNEKFKYDEAPWVEQEVKELPAYPDMSALAQVPLQGKNRHKYSVDHRSLNVGSDAIVRFAIAIQPQGAAPQVSYVGLRCETKEWKIYAHGTQANAWRKVAKPIWEAIEAKRVENFRHELYADFLCRGGAPIGNNKILSARLRAVPEKSYR